MVVKFLLLLHPLSAISSWQSDRLSWEVAAVEVNRYEKVRVR
jgi:hypothetical protein